MKTTTPKVFISLRPHISTYSAMTQGILDYARLHGPWLTCIMGIDNEFSASHFRLSDINGAIIESRPTRRSIKNSLIGIPTISCLDEQQQSALQTAPLVQIRCDNKEVAIAAADYLLSKAPQAFAFVNAPGNPPWSTSREVSFKAHLEEHGHASIIWRSKRNTSSGTFPRSFKKWLRELPYGTAIFAANDSIARYILNICLENKLEIPERYLVLGVDDNHLICETSTPSLSSISLAARETGFKAAQLLEKMMHGYSPPPNFTLTYGVRNVVERQSTTTLTRDTLIERIRSFSNNRLSVGLGKTITIPELVTALAISRRSLEVFFKQKTGRTLHDEIIRLKLEYAKKLIVQTQDKLELISSSCGFANSSHLCLLFKKHFGKSPSHFRCTQFAKD